jgi:general secretion pathway protein B
MSFILDALKKSESDRQRQNGPALYEVKVATPRAQLPLWAVGLGIVLAINLALVTWVLLRRPSQAATPPAQPMAQTTGTQAAPPARPVAAQGGSAQNPQFAANTQGPPATQPSTQQPAQPQPAVQVQPTTQPQQPAQGSAGPAQGSAGPAQGSAGPAQGSAGTTQGSAGAAQGSGGPAQSSAGALTSNQQTESTAQHSNPDDYAPATEPNNMSGFHARRGTESGLQLYSDASANGGMPELRLDMHAYAAKPQERFALINMKKVHEGETLPEGVRIESITPDGVVVSRNGTKFLLPRQ